MLLFVAIIPLLYVGLRAMINGPALETVALALDNFHGAVGEIVVDAKDKAYGDQTSFRTVAALWTNLVFTVAIAGGAAYGMWLLGFESLLTICATAALALTVFTMGGQFFLRFGITPVCFVLAAAIGVGGGVLIHGGQPVEWGIYRYGLSVIGGIIVAAIAFGGPLAWWYLLWQALYEAVAGQRWLLPLLTGMYDPLWKRARGFRDNFMRKYRYFQERFAAARERFNERYAAFQQRLNDRANKK